MQLLGLLAWLAVSFLAALIGGIASASAGDFYRSLVRPAWAPPPWLFAPVWTLLYLLMAVAAWLVWRRHGFGGAGAELILFLAQLAVNALWSWLFFAWRRGGLAFAGALALAVLVAATLASFWRLQAPAGALLVPYLAWVTFASALTWAVWQRNRERLG